MTVPENSPSSLTRRSLGSLIMMTEYLRNALGALLLLGTLGLAGCGGGSAGGGAAATGTGTGSGTTPAATAGVSVTLTDPATGAARTSIALGSPAKANATVLDSSGKAVANTVVTFAIAPTGLASMTPVTGTALTNASGVASIQIDPASLAAAGAAMITATASVGKVSVSGSMGFTISAVAAGLSGLAAGQNPLSAYGTTSVTVNVTGVPATTPVTVNFSSLCSASGKATLPASVQSVNGVATATYKDNGCGATDTISASIAGTSVTATTSLLVNSPGVASIQFVSATPATIVLTGTGGAGLSESSIVAFKVVDSNNQPIANRLVNFALTTTTGGIYLGVQSGTTGADGTVQVSVNAGTNPTAVWVTATVANTPFTTQSTMLRISTGRPAQDRFSLSVGNHNIEGWSNDGVTTPVNIIASDRVGNPVPDGTAVNFIAEGGQIQPTCTTTGGTCSVTFTSANPRPTLDSEPSVFAVTAGRATVLAYALGEESFTDLNGTNIYAAPDNFNDLGDVFLDNNEDHVWQQGEQFIPFNLANVSACNPSTPGAHPIIANSPLAPSKAGSCDGAWGSAHVRQNDVIVMSGSAAYINKSAPVPGSVPNLAYSMGGACSATISFYLFDINRNPMPAGTALVIGNLSSNIATAAVLPTAVPDSTAPGGTFHTITITAATTYCTPPMTGNGSLVLTVTTPKGFVTSIPLTVTP